MLNMCHVGASQICRLTTRTITFWRLFWGIRVTDWVREFHIKPSHPAKHILCFDNCLEDLQNGGSNGLNPPGYFCGWQDSYPQVTIILPLPASTANPNNPPNPALGGTAFWAAVSSLDRNPSVCRNIPMDASQCSFIYSKSKEHCLFLSWQDYFWYLVMNAKDPPEGFFKS